MGFLQGLGGAPDGGFKSGDGLVRLKNLSTADAIDGFRSVLDFRHIYGPNTRVPNIMHNGILMSGKVGAPNPFEMGAQPNGGVPPGPKGAMSQPVMGFPSVAMGGGDKQASPLSRALGAIGGGLQQMGQAPDSQLSGLPQQNDPLAILRSLGIDFDSNYLGRLGSR